MKEEVTLNRKEQNRVIILNQIETKRVTVDRAAMLLEVTQRHVWRLLADYRRDGASGIAHGNRGHKPINKIEEGLRHQVVELAGGKYYGFNQQHFTEKLGDKEGISLSRSTVRRILLKQGIRSPQRRRGPKHRSRRERYPQEGLLLQTDGSTHDWLEGRGPELCLIGAIDDATNDVPYACFQEHEDTKGYMLMLKAITLKRGLPLALYHDRHSIFEVAPDKEASIEEQLAGRKPLTQLGRLLDELGINSIAANSPQAKGRVERLWKTFQDRLTSELRLSEAKTKETANEVLKAFLPEYNQRFGVLARETVSAYRKLESNFKPDEYFCYKYPRTVGSDNVVRFVNNRLQILPNTERASYARCKVQVYAGLNGNLAVYYKNQRLDTRPAPSESTRLRTLVTTEEPKPRHYTKPSPDHPWRGKYRACFD
ncbi:MAG: ISNCY family transposase [bacterium]